MRMHEQVVGFVTGLLSANAFAAAMAAEMPALSRLTRQMSDLAAGACFRFFVIGGVYWTFVGRQV
jgi:hypothetical protein